MQLVLLLNNQVIDKIQVNGNKLCEPDYIIFLQQELLVRNEEQIEQCTDPPAFALDEVPSKMMFQSLLDLLVADL